MFGIPKSTLQDKVSGKVPISMRKGPEAYLPTDLEDHIKTWLITDGTDQLWSKLDVINKVQELVMKLKIPTPFPDAYPSRSGINYS